MDKYSEMPEIWTGIKSRRFTRELKDIKYESIIVTMDVLRITS